ncbi:MAG TPA: Lrp/AsnC ligand binding domain-containing protein, partial [Ktedonobacteraceae bacterium]|nr:Lrp/AsnC ligand binding domain-containing protein [Ktedonobacteraceae bacterium]
TGGWCVLLKVRVASPRALEQLISRIRALPDIQSTLTTLALSTFYEDGHTYDYSSRDENAASAPAQNGSNAAYSSAFLKEE